MIWSLPCGRWTLFAIEDGWFFQEPTVMFPDSDPQSWAQHVNDEGKLRVSLGCFALTDGERIVMVDTGAGPDSPPGIHGGQLPQALARIGLRPGDVGTVIHTHLHMDHVGGNRTKNGDAFFAEARYVVQSDELDYWLDPSNEAAEPQRAVMSGFVDQGRIEPISGALEVAPGVSVEPTPGHTPGHQSVVINSDSTRTVIAGDVTHHPVQVTHSHWNVPRDVDKPGAARTRERFFASLGPEDQFAAGHYPRPGLGRVELLDGTRVFVASKPERLD